MCHANITWYRLALVLTAAYVLQLPSFRRSFPMKKSFFMLASLIVVIICRAASMNMPYYIRDEKLKCIIASPHCLLWINVSNFLVDSFLFCV